MDNKEKFSNKAENYAKYRPSYPSEFIHYLLYEADLLNSVVADIGAGTGILTKLLSGGVNKIYSIEPNYQMRSACIKYCSAYDNIIIKDGSAEETELNDNSIDFITVAQAFHWFDKNKCKIEFHRILRKNGKLVLVWNNRTPSNELVKENDELCRFLCPDFKGFAGGSETNPESESDIFLNGICEYKVFDNDRLLTLEEYMGGSLSSSYAPSEQDSNYYEFIAGLKLLFKKYNRNGKILIPNKTYSYFGEIS